MNKAPDAFRTISEVADELDLPQHVLRFWESRFPHIRPMKRGGGRRYYRPEDIDLLRGIRHLLYGDGYTIRGVQRILREQGVRTVQSVGQGRATSLPAIPREDVQEAGQGADDEPNGATVLKFLSSVDAPGEDESADEIEEHEPDEPDEPPPELAPQIRPMAESNSMAAAPAPKSEAKPAGQASPPVAVPASKGMAPSKGLAPEELGRLKHALAELEACRRLLDKANEGER